nr:hypothetical protein BaRGS_027757 [Batillaria attramentaria]
MALLCFAQVTQAFTREIRAFKAKNYERQPFKRASWDTDAVAAGYQLFPAMDKKGGDISVQEMADRLASNNNLATEFVSSFMDIDGDGFISAKELLPARRR